MGAIFTNHLLVPVVLLASLTASPATAEPGQIDYDCDATPGHMSSLEVELPANARGITGTIRVDALYRTEDWLPRGDVRLSQADGRKWIGIRLDADRPRASMETRSGTLSFQIIDESGMTKTMPVYLKLRDSISFSIMVGEKSSEIKIGESAMTINHALSADRKIRVSCSTGDFKFLAVKPVGNP